MKFRLLILASIFLGQTLHSAELWSVNQLKAKLDQSSEEIILLDVRSKEEFSSGSIKDSINISHEDLLSNIALVSQYKSKKLVIYCRSGRRAEMVINKLESNGFLDIIDIEGDIMAWSEASYPLETKERR
tara:strand:+ start:505 stop:894 length:390 start_codon:yes stop_codon:yes gene_type:complete